MHARVHEGVHYYVVFLGVGNFTTMATNSLNLYGDFPTWEWGWVGFKNRQKYYVVDER